MTREIRLVRGDPEAFFREIRAGGGLTLTERRDVARRIARFPVPYVMRTHRDALDQACVVLSPRTRSPWHATFFLLRAHARFAIITRMIDGWTIGGTVPDLKDALDLMTLAVLRPERLHLAPHAAPAFH